MKREEFIPKGYALLKEAEAEAKTKNDYKRLEEATRLFFAFVETEKLDDGIIGRIYELLSTDSRSTKTAVAPKGKTDNYISVYNGYKKKREKTEVKTEGGRLEVTSNCKYIHYVNFGLNINIIARYEEFYNFMECNKCLHTIHGVTYIRIAPSKVNRFNRFKKFERNGTYFF